MSPMRCFGRGDLDVDDRLEHDRPRLGERVEERLAPGGDERDVLRVDRVALAVVDGDAHVLQRVAGEEAVVQHAAHAFLHRGDELVGDRAALHAVDELEALAARQRLDLEEHLAELAGAAGLLLVAAVALGARRDGLAVRDRRRPRVELELVLARHLLEDGAQVHLAQAAHHGLVGLRVVLDLEARILGEDLVQHVGYFLLVAALLRLHREAEHRHRQLERPARARARPRPSRAGCGRTGSRRPWRWRRCRPGSPRAPRSASCRAAGRGGPA